MKLEVIKPLEYLSPSSIGRILECPYSEYLLRCAGYQLPQMPQTEQMAIGSAFDAFVKAEISRLLGKEVKLAQLLESSVSKDNKHIIRYAHDLFNIYNYYGCVKQLMDEGIEDIELDIKKTVGGEKVSGTDFNLGGVPLFGKPDAMLSNNRPIDWKVNGWNSKTGQSPKPAYQRALEIKIKTNDQGEIISHTNAGDKGRHNNYPLPMEYIDDKWALQLLVYYWLGSKIEITEDTLCPKEVGIEQIAIRPNTICLVRYRTTISKDFAKKIYDTVKKIWTMFETGEFPEPQPSFQTCEPYNNPKVCTMVCEAYKNKLGNEMERLMQKGASK